MKHIVLLIVLGLIMPARAFALNGPLRVSTVNSRYLTDNSSKVIFLGGSNYWNAIQDGGRTNPPPAFDFNAFVNFLTSHGENYTKAHVWEQAWHQSAGSSWYSQPTIYVRSGPGNALDGGPKFDLTQFNPAYFDRLRQRVQQYGQNGIYVSVAIFDRFSVHDGNTMSNQWLGHPFNTANNINGINGDPFGKGHGLDTETLAIPAITGIQEAYIRHLVDTLDDLDNVIWEVAMEPWGGYTSNGSGPTDFVNHFINYLKTYEAGKLKQHPILQGVFYPSDTGDNSFLFSTGANIISPNGSDGFDHDCPTLTGTKVLLEDTDHINWTETNGADWAWRCFIRGAGGFAIMDGGYSTYDDQGGGASYTATENFRYNLRSIINYANKMNLLAMTPQGNLSSTGYALANSGVEYLVFQPATDVFTLNLASGTYSVEWYNLNTLASVSGANVSGGGLKTFSPPFNDPAVLYLKNLAAGTPVPSNTPGPSLPPGPSSTPVPSPTPAQTVIMGENSILSTDDANNGGLLVAQQTTLAQQGILQSLSFYINSAVGRLQLGVYNDIAGKPGNLIASTAVFTPVNGWNTQNVTTMVRLQPGTYWLAYEPESNNLHFAMEPSGTGAWFTTSFGELPTTFNTIFNSGSYHWSFYATLVNLPGDANGDGVVNVADLQYELTGWFNPFNAMDFGLTYAHL